MISSGRMDTPFRGFIITDPADDTLQGFVTTTTFSTWQRSFRFESRRPHAGISPLYAARHPCDDGTVADALMRVRLLRVCGCGTN
jgi:hypothetical protein